MAAGIGDRPASADAALDLVIRMLTDHAYEPRRSDRTVVMTNCPFHALAVGHTGLVCGLNHSMLGAFVDAIAPDLLDARLEPGENRCCVTLAALPEGQRESDPLGRRPQPRAAQRARIDHCLPGKC